MDTVKLNESRQGAEIVSAAIELHEPTRREKAGLRGSWPFSLEDIQIALASYSEEARHILVSAFRWCIDDEHPLHCKDFATAVGSSDNTLYKIYLAKYRYPNEIINRDGHGRETSRKPHPKAGQLIHPSPELLAKISKWLHEEKKQSALGKLPISQTPTLQNIVAFCHKIRLRRVMGWIVGPSHVGKTTALELEYTPKNNHGQTVYCRLPAAAGLSEVLICICKAMGLGLNGDIHELKRAIKRGLSNNMLLILDEVHLLAHTTKPKAFFKIMECLREIHDYRKAPMILCFTNLIDVKPAKQKELQQCWRRAPYKLFLPDMPTRDDLTAILKDNGLEFPERKQIVPITISVKDADGKVTRATINEMPFSILKQLAKDDGLLAITQRLKEAKEKAKAARKPVSWTHFVESHLEIAAESDAGDENDWGWN